MGGTTGSGTPERGTPEMGASSSLERSCSSSLQVWKFIPGLPLCYNEKTESKNDRNNNKEPGKINGPDDNPVCISLILDLYLQHLSGFTHGARFLCFDRGHSGRIPLQRLPPVPAGALALGKGYGGIDHRSTFCRSARLCFFWFSIRTRAWASVWFNFL